MNIILIFARNVVVIYLDSEDNCCCFTQFLKALSVAFLPAVLLCWRYWGITAIKGKLGKLKLDW